MPFPSVKVGRLYRPPSSSIGYRMPSNKFYCSYSFLYWLPSSNPAEKLLVMVDMEGIARSDCDIVVDPQRIAELRGGSTRPRIETVTRFQNKFRKWRYHLEDLQLYVHAQCPGAPQPQDGAAKPAEPSPQSQARSLNTTQSLAECQNFYKYPSFHPIFPSLQPSAGALSAHSRGRGKQTIEPPKTQSSRLVSD
ncbi:hypothetical protein L211DRAFT_850372 [Terfezia boudieri ATCC MYA-4762]|uniref:Uncharacterized protein n=1 Tax=Terfezia boudieri ATCC MYA-4762 TaxID=1051890 RepID=A0A3N4LJ97_9PEZI|nr:hypothetical protein L211DRAFT_850372 [Terfezia boudieri ATCC MYA-4762]